MRVLVVDDNAAARRVVNLTLSYQGVDVKEASSIDEIPDEEFDIYLIDTDIKGESGYELSKRIRERSKNPIFLLISALEEPDEERTNKIGIDGFITKPFDSETIIRTLGKYLEEGVKEEEEIKLEAEVVEEVREESPEGFDDLLSLEPGEKLEFETVEEIEKPEEEIIGEEEIPISILDELRGKLDEARQISQGIEGIYKEAERKHSEFLELMKTASEEFDKLKGSIFETREESERLSERIYNELTAFLNTLKGKFEGRLEGFEDELKGITERKAKEVAERVISNAIKTFFEKDFWEFLKEAIDRKLKEGGSS